MNATPDNTSPFVYVGPEAGRPRVPYYGGYVTVQMVERAVRRVVPGANTAGMRVGTGASWTGVPGVRVRSAGLIVWVQPDGLPETVVILRAP